MDGTDATDNYNNTDQSWHRPAVSLDLRRLGSLDSEALTGAPAEIAERMGIAIQTAREWRRLGRIPAMWLRAARALLTGDLGVLDDAWRGWRIKSGILRSPDEGDYVFTTADVMSLPYTRQRLAETQSRLEILERPPVPPEPLTRQLNWLTRSDDDHRYPTENDLPEELAQRSEERRRWEAADRNGRDWQRFRLLLRP